MIKIMEPAERPPELTLQAYLVLIWKVYLQLFSVTVPSHSVSSSQIKLTIEERYSVVQPLAPPVNEDVKPSDVSAKKSKHKNDTNAHSIC